MLLNTLRVQTEYVLVKSVGLKVLWADPECRGQENIPSPSVPCLNCGGGDRWRRHLLSLRGISPSLFVLSPVWCSRPMTDVLVAPCHDEFPGPRSDYVRQAASATTTTSASCGITTDKIFHCCFKDFLFNKTNKFRLKRSSRKRANERFVLSGWYKRE
ncbi:uncharacterized protein TNCV_1950841 [Trichonephila clavipes]|nr:uncharacterized protein TNCV_1950841 [Trichonephila clavipes]